MSPLCLESSMVIFIADRDSTLSSVESFAQRFLVAVDKRAIPHYSAGAVMDIDVISRPYRAILRDLAWTAGDNYVVALGEAAAAACRDQGVAYEAFPNPATDDPVAWEQIERQLDVLASRLPLDKYRYEAIRAQLFVLGYKTEWEWGQSVSPPETADDFASQAIWVICCSGFREQAARVTEARVFRALAAGRSATEVFPSSGKGRAIDSLWVNRHRHFTEFQALLGRNAAAEEIIAWIVRAKLPYVGGGILRYHFAKNLGVQTVKPDRHVSRLCSVPEDRPPEENFRAAMALCRPIAEATGDKIATVDLVLWRACNLGILDSLAARNSVKPDAA
jgi:hypothetical protein